MSEAQIDKQRILEEIKRTARANGGVALGKDRFFNETGIKFSDWHGKYWVRWGDAISEAGFEPNQLTEAYSQEFLIEKLIPLIRHLGRFPVYGDLRMNAHNDSDFPSHSSFRGLGPKAEWAGKVVAYCRERGLEDIVVLCGTTPDPESPPYSETLSTKIGHVYLVRHGSRKEYQIGKTFNPLRREGEIALQLPEKLEPIHYIKTDDPSGVENYWHTRFADKRKEGEWFALTAEDVRAFKRWKRIY